jgi:hypothetical protein
MVTETMYIYLNHIKSFFSKKEDYYFNISFGNE